MAGDICARARVIGPLKMLVAELFASAAGCDCNCALGSGNSTTVEVLLLPLSRARDVVDLVVIEETASEGVIQGAKGARKTGLWTMGVVAPRRLRDVRPPAEVDYAEGASGSSARCAWGRGGDA